MSPPRRENGCTEELMKEYLRYLFNEMLPSLFKGTVRFATETLRVVKRYALWIVLISAILYFTDFRGAQGAVDGFFHSLKNRLR